MSTLLPGMEGKPHNGTYDKDDAQQSRQRVVAEAQTRSVDRTNGILPSPRRRPAVGMPPTIRTVTPESHDIADDGLGSANVLKRPGALDSSSAQTSPRSIPGGEKSRDRRQGLVFQDSYNPDSPDVGRAKPPVSFHSRHRTRTLDEQPARQRSASGTLSKGRQRVGSVHSTNSPSFHDVDTPPPDTSTSHGFSLSSSKAALSSTSSQLEKSGSTKSGRRLVKRPSRPASPLPVTPNELPSVDSLAVPVPTGDANKILRLMKNMCGRMRGEVKYQTADDSTWRDGVCYIDEKSGALMYDGTDTAPFHVPVISNLRGCQVRPVDSVEKNVRYLEISNRVPNVWVCLLPLVESDFDLWLAALLSWQQIRTSPRTVATPRSGTPVSGERRGSAQRRDSATPHRDINIIKVANLLLWDKGVPTSPAEIVGRSPKKGSRSTGAAWRRVSCILQDNGELKLLTENDVTLLSVIQLSQLSRCAIQMLDKSVFDQEFCIAIFPQYAPTSTQLSIFRPVYIALETRLLMEVWFCLLIAFSVPEIYGHAILDDDDGSYRAHEQQSLATAASSEDLFRLEKTLSVRVVEAKIRKGTPDANLAPLSRHSAKPEDPSIGDYFVEIVLDGEVRARTMTKTETKNPFWREDVEFSNLPHYLPKLSLVLKRYEHPEAAVHGSRSSTSVHVPEQSVEVVVGVVDVPMEKLERGRDNETHWPILDDKGDQIGEMFLKLRNDEIVVLMSKDYQHISELLHKVSGTGLTIQISQVIPTSLRGLSEILLNIFQVSGHASRWLMTLVEDEIDGIGKDTPIRRARWSRRTGSNESSNAASEREQNVRDMGKSLQGEANLLFRGNSLLTQALDFHMRRLGKDYLEEVLTDKILTINAMNPDCEVDPSRLSHGEDVSKNWSMLIGLTNDVWESIAASATQCPPELRQIMKYIRAVAEDRYGDFLRTVAYTSVSGFLFLRFFCPAILNPKLFGLLRDHPRPRAQRTLTLIAKSLQALSNLSTFGQKESWMEPMNRFLSSHRQGVKNFIDAICNIPAERTTFASPASYSTPITILARLPPTSREGFPSLPHLIDHPRNFAALVKLWLESTKDLLPTEVLEGDLLAFHEVCVALQKRTDDCRLKAEQDDRSAGHLSLQWEDIVDSLEGATIQDFSSPNLASSQHSHSNSHSQQADLSDIYSPTSSTWSPDLTSGTAIPIPLSATPSTGHSYGHGYSQTHHRLAPGSSGSEAGVIVGSAGASSKDRQSFWEARFGGKEGKTQRVTTHETDLGLLGASPPSRGQSRAGKGTAQRGFLGLRKKTKGATGESMAGSYESEILMSPPPGSTWNGG